MASGSSSSSRVDLKSKVYDFGGDNILSSYEDYPSLDACNENYSDDHAIGTAAGKEFQKSRMAKSSAFPPSSYNQPEESIKLDMADTVDSTMKKYADNIMRFLEGIGSRISQLELYCYNIDKSIGEMHSELARDNGEADLKLKFLEKNLQEVHRSVQILRDKQELAETQKELAKIQLAHKGSSSLVHSRQSEERVSASVSDPIKNDYTSDTPGQQLPLALPSHISAQPSVPTRPVEQRQQPIVAPQGHTPSQGYYLHSVQLSNIPSQMQQTQSQYLPSDSQYRTSPQPTQSQVNQILQNHSLPQYQQHLSQQGQQQTSFQAQMRPSSVAAYAPPYVHGQAANPSTSESLPTSMPLKMSFSGISQTSLNHPEGLSYGYVSLSRPVHQQPPNQHLKATHPRDGYVTSSGGGSPTLSPKITYMMYDVERDIRPHQSHIQQNGHSQNHPPGVTNLVVRSPQIMRNHAYREVCEKLVSIGYQGDQVSSVIQRLEESGQPVDFNAVLDRLNALSSGGSRRAWSG